MWFIDHGSIIGDSDTTDIRCSRSWSHNDCTVVLIWLNLLLIDSSAISHLFNESLLGQDLGVSLALLEEIHGILEHAWRADIPEIYVRNLDLIRKSQDGLQRCAWSKSVRYSSHWREKYDCLCIIIEGSI